MKRKRFVWQIYPWNLVVILASLLTFGFFMMTQFRNHLQEQRGVYLEKSLRLLHRNLPVWDDPNFSAKANQICQQFGVFSFVRFRVLSEKGEVLADSKSDGNMPVAWDINRKIQRVLQGKRFLMQHLEKDSERKTLILAVPFVEGDQVRGVLEASVGAGSRGGGRKPRVWIKLTGIGIGIAMLAALISLVATRKLVQPMEGIKEGAKRLASGDLRYRIPVPKSEELGKLAETLNQMAGRLERLEEVRQEFVANVSHELKTPISSIKGFMETLIQRPPKEPLEAKHFQGIILKEAQRLDTIVRDLLHLSQLENDLEREGLELTQGSIREVLESAVEASQAIAKEKGLRIELNCSRELSALMSPRLLEQAILNLVANAVSHSDPGKTIEVSANQVDKEIIIAVEDHGCGIAEEHLPRIFERFYRVDKGRSRKQGGTGLGLAIVKHIVQAHHGNVSVKSKVGQGSVFSITLLIFTP